MRFIVFGGWFGSRNLGDDAILIGLRRVMERTFPDAELVALSTDVSYTRRVCGVEAIDLMSARGLFRRGDASLPAYLQAFMDADACIVSGGTPIYDYGHLSRSFHFGLPRITGTPLICFGVGVKSIESMMGASSVRMLLRGARLVSTRDALSRDELVRLGVCGQISVTGDSGLFLKSAEREDALRLLTESGADTSRPMTAICPRFLSTLYRRHYHDPLSSFEVSRIRRGVAEVADHLLRRGFEVIFLPFHRGPVDDDLAEIGTIVSLMHGSAPKIVKRYLLPSEAMSVLGCMEMVFGLRLHSLIFAASLGVPVVGVNYDSKIRGFMELAGAWKCLCEISGEPKSWVEVVDAVLDDGGVMGRVVSRSCGEMKARILDEAGKMRDLLKAGY